VESVGWAVHGTHVRAQYYAPEGKPKHGAIFIHGFRSCIEELGELPPRAAEAGIAALAVDLRGHGESAGERGRIDLERTRDDVDAALIWLRKRIGKKPVTLVGHSLGASLALGIAARSRNFASVVAAHPVHNILDELSIVERPVFHGLGRIAQRRARQGKSALRVRRATNVHHGYADRNLGKVAARLRYLQPEVNLANYSFAATMDATAWAQKVQVPVLGISSRRDRVVKPAHTAEVLDAIPHLLLLRHDGGHACFRDRDRTHVIQGAIDFIRQGK
jgi:alpha-beta hydrolase superfamily lysophospholipase